MDRHLISVEVGVEGRADQRMDLDRAAVDQHRLERLDAQTVQRGRAVEQHRASLHHIFEHAPDLGLRALDGALRTLDVGRQLARDQLVDQERLEQLQRHPPRQPALVQLELGADHDHRTARVVHPLAQQVLAEAALLALQHVREALQPVAAAARHRAPPPPVVDQRVDRLLQHPLLVADDDLRRAQLEQPLQPVVAVDRAPIEVVQVRSRKAPAVQLHHRAQIGRQHRQRAEEHPGRVVVRLAQPVHDPQSLHRLLAPLPGRGRHLLLERLRRRLQVHPADQREDRLRAHLTAHHAGVLLHQLLGALLAQDRLVEIAGRDRVHQRRQIAVDPILQLLLGALLERVDLLAQPLLLLRHVLARVVGARVGLRAQPRLVGRAIGLPGGEQPLER